MRVLITCSRLLALVVLVCVVAPAFGGAKKGGKQKAKKKDPKPRTVQSVIKVLEHDIHPLAPGSFDGVISKNRDLSVSSVMFYRSSDTDVKATVELYDLVAKDSKGMLKVAALDCDAHPKFCEDKKIEKTPVMYIYPPNPQPVYEYQWKEGAKDNKEKAKAMVGAMSRHVPGSHVTVLEPSSFDSFRRGAQAIPKVLLFSSKKSAPVTFRALSNALHKTMAFGFVHEDHKDIVTKYKIKTFPSLVVIGLDDKPNHYKDEFVYSKLHDFLNIFAETFVKGGGYEGTADGDVGIPDERIPQITQKSHQHVCFKKKGLCVVLLLNSSPISAEHTAMMEDLSEQFVSHLDDRGTVWVWSWMDLSIETNWAEMFEVKTFPSVAVINPAAKRMRFTKLAEEEVATTASIKLLLDKISGGDARFKAMQKIPSFVVSDSKAQGTKSADL